MIYTFRDYRVEFQGITAGSPEFQLSHDGHLVGAGVVINALDELGEGSFWVDYKPKAQGAYSLPVTVLSFVEASAYQYWMEAGEIGPGGFAGAAKGLSKDVKVKAGISDEESLELVLGKENE